jgi:hypothetical protein
MPIKALTRAEFEAAQEALMSRGKPADPCGACGCARKSHKAKSTFSYAKSGASSGKSVLIPTLAPTCCECPHCFCFCTTFVEPFAGQKFLRCVYEPVPIPSRATSPTPGG